MMVIAEVYVEVFESLYEEEPEADCCPENVLEDEAGIKPMTSRESEPVSAHGESEAGP